MTSARTMTRTRKMDSGSRRKRRLFFAGGSFPGPVASRPVGAVGGLGGGGYPGRCAWGLTAGMGSACSDEGVTPPATVGSCGRPDSGGPVCIRSVGACGSLRGPWLPGRAHVAGPSSGGPCGLVTHEIVPYPPERSVSGRCQRLAKQAFWPDAGNVALWVEKWAVTPESVT